MKIYMIYKKSDRSITGFVAEDRTRFEETSTHAISTNKVSWSQKHTINSVQMIKTFEDVALTINDIYQVNESGSVNEY